MAIYSFQFWWQFSNMKNLNIIILHLTTSPYLTPVLNLSNVLSWIVIIYLWEKKFKGNENKNQLLRIMEKKHQSVNQADIEYPLSAENIIDTQLIHPCWLVNNVCFCLLASIICIFFFKKRHCKGNMSKYQYLTVLFGLIWANYVVSLPGILENRD